MVVVVIVVVVFLLLLRLLLLLLLLLRNYVRSDVSVTVVVIHKEFEPQMLDNIECFSLFLLV